MTTEKILVSNEDDVISILKDIIENKNIPDIDGFAFIGWPKLVFHLEGPQYHQSITPTVMRGLLEVQKEVYRAYALARYNSLSTRHLTEQEREELEFCVEVENGSSELEIDFQAICIKFIEMVGEKMEPEHVVITILGMAAFYFGSASFKAYLDQRSTIREAELKSETDRQLLQNMRYSSAAETERFQVMLELSRKDYRLANLQKSSYDVHTNLLRSSSTSIDAEIQGVNIAGDVADILSQNARRRSIEIRIDGHFKILKVDARKPDEFKVTVVNIHSGEEIDAVVQDVSLSSSNKSILQEAEWSRAPVSLKINAKKLDDEIRSAVVIDVEKIAT